MKKNEEKKYILRMIRYHKTMIAKLEKELEIIETWGDPEEKE